MKTVLLIEDTDEIRENITEILEMHGFEMLCACNGEEGMHLLQAHRPDIIVSDIKMPRINGFQLLQMVRAENKTANIPFIFISASAQKEDIEKGREAGAYAYLIKPFSAEELISMIHALVPA